MSLEMLRECRNIVGMPPRTFSLWDRWFTLPVTKPEWVERPPKDRLSVHFRRLESLFAEGIVVWGRLVQANAQLFDEGEFDCPGEFVYSLLDSERASPDYLTHTAAKLAALKGRFFEHPEVNAIAEHLTNERTRVYGLPVPREISPQVRCAVSTTMFVRKHMPGGRICAGIMPILVHPHEPHTVTILPKKFWPPELVRWYMRGG